MRDFIQRDTFSEKKKFIISLLEVPILQVRRLTDNREWNTKLVSTVHGETAKEIVTEFNELWNSNYALTFDEFYENYNERYKIIKHQREVAKQEEITSIEKYKLQPNSMQIGFIINLKKDS